VGRIYRRGDTWHAYYTDPKGVARRQSLRTQDREVARARLRQLELASTDPAAYSLQTLKGALDDLWSAMATSPAATVGAYQQKARHLARVLGAETPLTALTRDAVVGYVDKRLEEKSHPHTVHKEVVVLRRALTEAVVRRKWAGDPRAVVPSIKAQYRPRDTWLEPERAEKLLLELEPHRCLWALIAIYGGLRSSEVEGLRWRHIDLRRQTMLTPGRKTEGAWRSNPLPPVLVAAFAAVGPGAPDAPVVERWGNVRRDLRAALARADGVPFRKPGPAKAGTTKPDRAMPPISPNDLRRTFASWMVQAGVPLKVVARLLGHASTRMADRTYGHLADQNLRDAVEKLCAAGVQHKTSDLASESPQADRVIAQNAKHLAQLVVPRDGIEPPTRGFSVRVSKAEIYRHNKRKRG
jgi:integrase